MTDASTMPASDPAVFGRRTAALLAASSEHLPRVLDVTVLGERRELELEAPGGPTLGELLARRRRLTPGEAVTTVIGAVRAVAALHAAGFCGVTLDDDGLRFDGSGRPLLLGLEALRETIQAGAQGVADDWRAVAALADRLGLVAHGRAAGALGPAHVGLGLALATLTAGESAQSVDRLEAALFELAEPEAVCLDAAPTEARAEPAVSPLAVGRRSAAHRRPSSSVLIEAFEAGPAALLAGPLGRLRSRAAELPGLLHGRAWLLVVAAAVAVVVTVAIVLLLPQGSGRAAAGPSPRAGVTAAPSPSATTTVDPRLTGSDPVAAASVLLAQRDGCLPLDAPAREACLARLADGSAAALAQPARPLAGLAPSLLERSGDSALVALTPRDPKTAPASALLMRTEAGWRLRQLYEN